MYIKLLNIKNNINRLVLSAHIKLKNKFHH